MFKLVKYRMKTMYKSIRSVGWLLMVTKSVTMKLYIFLPSNFLMMCNLSKVEQNEWKKSNLDE
jgi:hypothetical protein